MARSALLVACGLLVLAPLAGCSGLAGDPGSPASPSPGATDAPDSPERVASSPPPTTSPTDTPPETSTPTASRSPTPAPSSTPTPASTSARRPLGSADAPDGPDLAGVPARYRAHVAATERYRLSSSFVVDSADDRVDRVDARAIRGTGVAADRVRRADTFRAYDDDLTTARTTTASYRPATGPHLYRRGRPSASGLDPEGEGRKPR